MARNGTWALKQIGLSCTEMSNRLRRRGCLVSRRQGAHLVRFSPFPDWRLASLRPCRCPRRLSTLAVAACAACAACAALAVCVKNASRRGCAQGTPAPRTTLELPVRSGWGQVAETDQGQGTSAFPTDANIAWLSQTLFGTSTSELRH